MTDDDKARTELLGQVLQCGQTLEVISGALLGAVLRLPNPSDGIVLGRRMSASGVISACQDFGAGDHAVLDWCKSASRGFAIRNRYVHGIWTTASGGDPHKGRFVHRGRRQVFEEIDPLPELRAAAEELTAVIRQARKVPQLDFLWGDSDDAESAPSPDEG